MGDCTSTIGSVEGSFFFLVLSYPIRLTDSEDSDV
jgi:hypothetical protein